MSLNNFLSFFRAFIGQINTLTYIVRVPMGELEYGTYFFTLLEIINHHKCLFNSISENTFCIRKSKIS